MAGSKTAKKQGKGTREQLLESACKLFAEKGYRDTTIAEICALSGANIAAVNYYFQDKKRLYAEAWRLTFERSMRAHPARGDRVSQGLRRVAGRDERVDHGRQPDSGRAAGYPQGFP